MKAYMLWMLLVPLTSNASDRYVDLSFGGYSTHLYSKYNDENKVRREFNSNHSLIGLEYRTQHKGYGILTFNNSYYDRSVALLRTYYYQPNSYVELIASAGLVTGYGKNRGCLIRAGSICSLVAVGIQVGQGRLKGRVTWFGTALVLTGTWRF